VAQDLSPSARWTVLEAARLIGEIPPSGSLPRKFFSRP
jgi:hypothetical protein